jgi:Ca2+-binding RTX toxin-like protein
LGTADSVNLGNLVVDGAGLTTVDTITVDGNAKTVSLSLTGADGIGSDLTGGSKADTLTGGTGDDVLVGNAGDDVISGGDGNDNITGGAGADTMTGGDGDDTYVFASAAHVVAGESIVEAASGGTDIVDVNATVDFTNMAASSFDEIDTLDIADSITATFTADQLTGETIEIETAGGGTSTAIVVNVGFGGTVDLSSITATANWIAGEDTITINGLGGAETITGTAENDTINLGAGADTVKVAFGGAGEDTITGFTAGASADVFDFTGTIDTTDGANAYEAIATGTVDTATGLIVCGTGLASADAAGIQSMFDTTTSNLEFAAANDVVYFLGDFGGDSYLFKLTEAGGNAEFTAAEDTATLIAVFSGIADATTLTADNFADFIA